MVVVIVVVIIIVIVIIIIILSYCTPEIDTSISEVSSCFFGPRPRHIEIRHRVKKKSTINLFGFETLKLKIRRLKLWKPTVMRDGARARRCGQFKKY